MKVEVNVEFPQFIRALPYQAFHMSLNVHLSNTYNYSYLLYEPCVAYVIILLIEKKNMIIKLFFIK
jgi:hypothetical protein